VESSARDGPVAPRDLRLGWRGRWRAANVLTRRLGTPLARTIPPWRWIAASAWFLTLTMSRAGTAGIGRACVTTQTITERQQFWYPVVQCSSLAVIVFLVAVLVARPVDVLRGIGLLGSVGS
jgi:hypothetical protein